MITKEIDAWLRYRTDSHMDPQEYMTPDQLDAVEAAMLSGRATPFEFTFKRAMGHVPGAGQELYDRSDIADFDIPMDSANLTRHVTHDPTATQDEYIVPADDDAQVMGEILTDTTQHNAADVVTKQLKFQGYQVTSKTISVHASLMMTHPDYSGYILGRLARRLIKAQEFYCLQGTGTNQPTGLHIQAPDSGQAIATAGVTYESIVNVEQSVNQDYRYRSIWVMHPDHTKGIKKLTDSAGRPAWIPRTPLGEWPATLLGHPVVETPRCPTSHLFFGDFSYVHWRESQLVRLIQALETKAEYNQTLFSAVVTFDSGLSLNDSLDPPVTRSSVS